MGLFDYFRSSYDLGEAFTNVRCQSKDFESVFNDYWLDPKGYLWRVDYSGTQDFEVLSEDHPDYDAQHHWLNSFMVPNGKHGRVVPHYVTAYVEVYPEVWEGRWEDCPRMRLHFRGGKLMEYEDITGR